MCNHYNCNHVLKNCSRGVGVLYLVDYRKVVGGKPVVGQFAVVGKERGGKYRGEYNVVGGSMKTGCWIDEAVREMREEVKHDIAPVFDAQFRHPGTKRVRWIIVGRTPVLVGKAPRGFSRAALNKEIAAANADPSLPAREREMECVEFARLGDDGKVRNPEGQELPASAYLLAALAELRDRHAELQL